MTKFTPEISPALINRYQRLKPYLPALFFVSGFLFDILTIGRIDNIFNIISHGSYLGLILIILRNQILEKTPTPQAGRIVMLIYTYQNEALHFLLGALLNAFIIFYFKSGSFANSSLLLIILSVLLVVNELPLFKNQGPALKVALIIISLTSYFIYLIPVLIGTTGIRIFLLSLFCTALMIFLMWWYLSRQNVAKRTINLQLLVPACCVIFFFVLLYTLRIIPPVPLSLKHLGIYHEVEKTNGQYVLSRQTPSWKFWSRGDQDFQAQEGDRIFLFAKIFSPGGFRGRVYIHFQKKTEQ
ncbi:hypothetical protein ACFL6N_03955 [Thermodesulfobacteriota bacterium]